MDNVTADSYTGLTIDFCVKKNATHIVRGLRTAADFEFERGIAQMNRSMNNNIDTMFKALDLASSKNIGKKI